MSRYQPRSRDSGGGSGSNYPNSSRYQGGSSNSRHHSYNERNHDQSRTHSSRGYDDRGARGYHDRGGRGEPAPPGEDIRFQQHNQPFYPVMPPIPPRLLNPMFGVPQPHQNYQANFHTNNNSFGSFDQRRAYEQERNYNHQQGQNRYDNRDRNSQRRPDDGGQQEVGFRIDTAAEPSVYNLSRAYGNRQYPAYSRLYYRDNVLGGSEHYVKNVQFGCKLTVNEDLSSPVQEATKTPDKVVRHKIKTIEFFSMSETSLKNTSRSDEQLEEDPGLSRKEAKMTLQERVEYYNVELRNQPSNEPLWREFVQFQEQVFGDAEQDFEDEAVGESKKSKKKGRRKAMLEKQVAILDKAVGLNPKNLELHLLRLNTMFEIFKPNFVLTEWKKLVATTHAQIAPFWMEYLVFACSDLQIFTTTSVTQSFERAFEKFRGMLMSDLPESQKPEKFSIFLADLLFSLSLVLKAAGHTERALSFMQAQLEINFQFPNETFGQRKSKDSWKSVLALLERFWKMETRRYGEEGAIGWANSIGENGAESTSASLENTTVSDNEVTEFEDRFFESLTDVDLKYDKNHDPCKDWLFVESLRSKLYWMPWRSKVSDVECDDSQRMVPFCDVSPFLVKIPTTIYNSEFDKNASYFRYVVNYLLLLREDFLPKTYTLDSILSPFVSISLTESRTLLNEIHYWKKFLSLYHDEDCSSDKVPEGFQINEFNSPGYFTSVGKGSLAFAKPPVVTVIPNYSNDVELKAVNLLKSNQMKYLNMVRSIVQQSLEHLDSPFAIILTQMLLRFEQKNTYASLQSHKSLMKFARNLMKHEKLRNSTGTYGEVALIEYFAGKNDKAIELLVKTINTSSKMIHTKDEIDVEEDWELITDLCRLYRLLAELHLKQNSQISLNILLALGNKFDSVNVLVDENLKEKPKNKNATLKAKRQFENILKSLVPFVFDRNDISIEGEVSNIATKLDGDKCIEYLLQKPNLIVEWTCSYALFQFLSDDFESASEIYDSVLTKIKVQNCLSRASKYDSADVSISNLREQLYLGWCKLGAMAVSQNPMVNSKFRTILGNALQEFPSSPPFLVLFAQVERQCSVAGRLWRAMLNLVKQESTQTIVTLHWTPLFMSLNLAMKIDELEHDAEMSLEPFGLGGPAVPPDTIFYKLDAILSAAETNAITKHCPLIWRVHMKHLAVRVKEGKDRDRARSLFYDAIRHCPSNKSIYLDAIAYFPEMKQEVIDLMNEKQILVRLPKEEFELLMEIDSELKDELEASTSTNKRGNNSSESDSEKHKSKKRKKTSPEEYDDGEIVSD